MSITLTIAETEVSASPDVDNISLTVSQQTNSVSLSITESSSIILRPYGEGPPGVNGADGATGATGPTGPTGPEQPLGKVIAMAIVFG